MTADRPSGGAARGAILITGSTYISYALGLLAGAIVARHLGPADYGRYAFLLWLVGWLVVVGNHGLTTSGIRFVAESLGKGSIEAARSVHGYLLRMQHISVALVLALYLLLAAWIQPDEWSGNLLLFIGVGAISMLARATYLFDISIAKGYGAFQVEAYSTVAVGLLNAAAVATLAFAGAGLPAFVVLSGVASLATGLFAAIHLRRAGIRPAPPKLEPEAAQHVRKHLYWTVLLIAATTLGGRSIETFTLSATRGPEEIGFFAIAANLARGSIDLLTIGLTTVLMPTMGRAFGAGGAPRVQVIFSSALRYFVFIGLILAGMSAFWSMPVVTLLYGPRYEPVIGVLQAFQIAGGLTLSEAAFGSLLATTGRQSSWAKISSLAVPLSAVLAPVLIPRYGLTGAVISVCVSRGVSFTVLAITVIREHPLSFPVKALRRLLFSALIAGGVAAVPMLAMPGLAGHLIAGAIYLPAFFLLSITFGAWAASDVGMALTLVARVPRLLGWLEQPLRRWEAKLSAS